MREPGLSIIIPVYNIEEYLPACLDSIISQSYRDYEVLLIDDGSTDSSGRICDEYARRDNVRVFHTANGGVSHARNTGIANASGRYIYFIDGDDLLADSETLGYMMSVAEAYPGEIARFRSNNIGAGAVPRAEVSSSCAAERITDRERICSYVLGAFIFQFLIPEAVLGDLRFNEDFSLGEDIVFLSELLTEADAVIDCDRVVYYRVLREGSAVHSDMKAGYYDDIDREYRIINRHLSRVCGGEQVFAAMCADQTGAISKISRNYKEQTGNIRRARGMIMRTFPGFLRNPWLDRKTRLMVTAFMISPRLFYLIYCNFKKTR